MQIAVNKKRKDRSITNEPSDERPEKISGRNDKEARSSERNSANNKFEFSTISKGSPFNKMYQNAPSYHKRIRAKSKKHHTGSEILLKEHNRSKF